MRFYRVQHLSILFAEIMIIIVKLVHQLINFFKQKEINLKLIQIVVIQRSRIFMLVPLAASQLIDPTKSKTCTRPDSPRCPPSVEPDYLRIPGGTRSREFRFIKRAKRWLPPRAARVESPRRLRQREAARRWW